MQLQSNLHAYKTHLCNRENYLLKEVSSLNWGTKCTQYLLHKEATSFIEMIIKASFTSQYNHLKKIINTVTELF